MIEMKPGDVLYSSLARYKVVKITAKTVLVNRVDADADPAAATNTYRENSDLICRKVHNVSGRVHIHISKHECAYI
jgi:hypothetical protein